MVGIGMKRREFLGLIGSVAAWPFAARAQQKGRIPTIGVIMGDSADDAGSRRRVIAFESSWPELGWIEGRTIHVDYRWATVPQLRAAADDLVASKPDVIVANGISVVTAMREATQSIPVVFTGISDPDGIGLVANLARPGGNMTGFANFEASIGGKWLQTLKEIAPHLTRVGALKVGKTHPRILQSGFECNGSGRLFGDRRHGAARRDHRFRRSAEHRIDRVSGSVLYHL
jgi:putative ABC transport system substrate-binding protein